MLVQLLRAVQSRRVKRTLVRHGPKASHQSQGKIENANRVTNGVCRAMWLSLENFPQEKLASDSILMAWLIRHAAWSLTRFQVKNDERTAFVRVLWKASTSQVLPFGERVMYKYTAVQTGKLDQRWAMVSGSQSTSDRRAHRSQARSLHRVPPEERFVISELKKVRGLPWNGRAEYLNAAIVTQQDKGPSGHRRVYLTTKVVARFGATPGCSGCVGLGSHTEGCRVRLEKVLADERASASPVGAGIGPIAEPATEPRQPPPAEQLEPASSSSGPAVPMPTQNLQKEQLDSPTELGAQERRERKGARPNEMLSSEISERSLVKARPASPPTIVETRKDPNSPAIRCRLCATEVNTGEPRSDTFAATSL